MFASGVFWAVCLASSTILAATVLDKPYYDTEDAENLFRDYVKQYNKEYNRVEYLERLEIFKKSKSKNLDDINERNAKYPMTVFGVNKFTDLKPEELKQYNGFKLSNETMKKVTIPDGPTPPDSFDWRDYNAVSHVKNQGACGSCFIFSAVGNIEGQYAIKHQECLALSEGEALDCLHCGTCHGGIMDKVFSELGKTAGLEKEADYPYVSRKTECHKNDSEVAAKVLGGKQLSIPDEDVLKQKLADIGPLAVAISSKDLFAYQGGILLPDKCKGKQPDHGMVLVGYGEAQGTKYWTIKNSWGEEWGESGYVRLLRGVNACVMGTSYTATADVAPSF